MKVAILCNGPSKTLYKSSSVYDTVIGCNIPWCDVNFTVVGDKRVIAKEVSQKGLIQYPMIIYNQAYDYVRKHNLEYVFADRCLEYIMLDNPTSAGNGAAQIALLKGYTVLDVYGADAIFSENFTSSTQQYIPWPSDKKKEVIKWRERWKQLAELYPEATINFIRK